MTLPAPSRSQLIDSCEDLALVESFVPEHERWLESLHASVHWDRRIRARATASFGRPYDYSGLRYAPAAFPAPLERLRLRVAAAVGWVPDNCLLNLYVDGRSTMGLHADATEGLMPGSGIAIVSLGETRTLVFRASDESYDAFAIALPGGSLLHMPLSAQACWRHGIRTQPGAGERISATFRRRLDP